MRWQRNSLSLALAMGIAVAVSSCTEHHESPAAPDGPQREAAKPVLPPYMPEIDQAWLAELYNAYASITEWNTYWIPQEQIQGSTVQLIPEGWDPAKPVTIVVEGMANDPFVGGGLRVRFPAGENAFPYNAIFYDVELMTPSQVVYMSFDPNRYTADVIGTSYTSFQFGPPPQGGEPYSITNLFTGAPDWTTAAQPLKLTLRLPGDVHFFPDREAGVIIPSGGPPAPPIDPDD